MFIYLSFLLQDLESAASQQTTTAENLSSRARALAVENETLRQELARATAAAASDSVSLGLEGGDAQELAEQLAVVSEEADLLRQEVQALTEDSSQLRAALSERDAELDSVSAQLRDAQGALGEARARLGICQQEKSAAEARCAGLSRSLGEAQRSAAEAESKASALEAERDDLNSTLDEYKKALAELNAAAEAESEQLTKHAQSAADRARELGAKLAHAAAENDELQTHLRDAERELESSRQDCENMLSVMNSLEKQVADAKANRDRVTALEEEAIAKVEAAVLDRDAAQAKESQARREIARLLERRRLDMTEAAESEEAAVADVKGRLEGRLAEREAEANQHALRVQELSSELALLQQQLSSAETRHAADTEAWIAQIGEAEAAVERCGAEAADSAHAARDAAGEAERVRLEMAELKETHEATMDGLRSELYALRVSHDGTTQKLQASEARLTQLKAEHTALQREFDEKSLVASSAAAAAENESLVLRQNSEQDVRMWRSRVEELLGEVQSLERRLHETESEHRTSLGRMMADTQNSVRSAEQRMHALRAERDRATEVSAHAHAEVASLQHRCEEAQRLAAASDAETRRLQAAYDALAGDDAAKAGRLADLVSSEQRNLSQISTMKRDVQQLTARAQRSEERALAAEDAVCDAAAVHDAVLAHLAAEGVDIPPSALALSAQLGAVREGMPQPRQPALGEDTLAEVAQRTAWGAGGGSRAPGGGAGLLQDVNNDSGVYSGFQAYAGEAPAHVAASGQARHAAELEAVGAHAFDAAMLEGGGGGGEASEATVTAHASGDSPGSASRSGSGSAGSDLSEQAGSASATSFGGQASRPSDAQPKYGQAASGRLADRDVNPGRFTSPVTELDSPVTRAEGAAGGGATHSAHGGSSPGDHSSSRSSYDLEDFE